MNINRHNYEEYFILYMDNELGSDDRQGVEEFVQKHPDLKEELEILLQYKMTPDTSIVYSGKEELMMPQTYSPINLNNYEEWLVLYLDNELDAEQIKDVERFAALHAPIQEELGILQQTKLQPEQEVVFPDKESLYRRSEKIRVIYFNWRSIAVAAVLFIAIGITALMIYNKKSTGHDGEVVSISAKRTRTNAPNSVIPGKESNQKIDQPVIANNIQQALTQTSKERPGGSTVKNTPVKKALTKNLPAQGKEEEPIVVNNNQKPSNNLPKPFTTINTNNDVPKESLATNTNTSNKLLTADAVTTPAAQPYYTSNPSVNNEDLNQSGGKKSKLRGFFRKVARTFEKNTNINATDDDRLLVGGLAFKLK